MLDTYYMNKYQLLVVDRERILNLYCLTPAFLIIHIQICHLLNAACKISEHLSLKRNTHAQSKRNQSKTIKQSPSLSFKEVRFSQMSY